MLYWSLILACQTKEADTVVWNPLDFQVYSSERTLYFPQRALEWWEMVDDRIHILAGAGILFGDINSDDHLDIVHLRKNGVNIHIQDPDLEGEWFSTSYDEDTLIPCSGAILDWDQDGDTDLMLNMVYGPDVLWTQTDGEWASTEIESPYYSTGNAWYDVNQDGLLDFLSAGYGDDTSEESYTSLENGQPYPGESNFLYLQTVTGEFEVSTLPSSQIDAFTFIPSILPYLQGEQWDALMVHDFGQVNGGHQLYEMVNGTLEEHSMETGLEAKMNGMGIDATDINGDLIPDVFITNITHPIFLTSLGDGTWAQSAQAYGLTLTEQQEVCWGVDWYDANNDGHEDLWIGCGPLLHPDTAMFEDMQTEVPDALFLWTPDGFVDVAPEWGLDRINSTRAGGFVDINEDGCAELARVARNGPTEIFLGDCPAENAWLDIELDDGNAGIGATVITEVDGQRQVRWMTAGGTSLAAFFPQVVHFGFGKIGASTVDVEIRWSDGSISSHSDIAPNQRIAFEKQ